MCISTCLSDIMFTFIVMLNVCVFYTYIYLHVYYIYMYIYIYIYIYGLLSELNIIIIVT